MEDQPAAHQFAPACAAPADPKSESANIAVDQAADPGSV